MANEYKIAIHIAGKLEKSLGSSVKEANGVLDTLGNTGGGVLGGINKGLSVLGKATVGVFGATGAAMAAAAKQSITTGMAFEDAMANTAAIAGVTKTSAEFQKLKAAAEEMGRTTSKTAAESADALGYMALAGWDVQTSVDALPGILHLSEATGLDLATTSDLVTDSMSAMGVEVGDLTKYMDVLAKAQNSSNMNVQQEMDAFIKSGGILQTLGVGYKDAATTLGLMANSGLKGAEAGTALNAILRNLTKPSGESAKAMEALGISMFDAEGNFVGMEEGLWRVHEALSGLTEEEQTQYLQQLGGEYGSKLGLLLKNFDQIKDEQGNLTTGWKELSSEIENSTGALDEMRDTKLDTLTGDVSKLTSALEALENKFYEAMNGSLRETVQWLTDKVGELQTAFEEGGLDQFATTLGTTLADAATKAAEKAPEIIKSIGTVATGIVEAFGSEDTAMQLAAAATTIVDTLAVEMFGLADTIGNTALTLIDAFVNKFAAEDGVGKLADAASKMLQGLTQGFNEHGDSIMAAATTIITQLAAAFPQLAESYGGMALTIITKIAEGIGEHGAEIGQAAAKLLTELATGIVEHLPTIINAGIAIVGGLMMGLIQAAGALIAAVPSLFSGVVDAILGIDWLGVGLDIVTSIWSGMQALWGDFMDWVSGLRTEPGDVTLSNGDSLAPGWSEGLEEGTYMAPGGQVVSRETAIAQKGLFPAETGDQVAQAAETARAAVESVGDAAEQSGEKADAASKSWQIFSDNLGTSEGADTSGYIPETVDTSALDETVAAAAEMTASVGTEGTAAGEALSTNFATSAQGAVTTAQTTATSITSAFNGLYFEMISIGMHIGEGLVQGMNAMIAQVQASAANLANAASDAIAAAAQVHSPSDITTEIGEFIGEGLPVGMKKSLPGVTAAAGELGRAATDRSSILGGMSVNRGMGGGGSINFSPVINLSGTNLTQGDVRNAMKMSMAEFEKMMQKYQRKRGRVAFA
jgi:TP901 family phage tail tape measure protein